MIFITVLWYLVGVDSERTRSVETGNGEPGSSDSPPSRGRTARTDDGTPVRDPVEVRLDDALERVAHGATVSVPAIFLSNGLAFAFTVVLTNGFGAAAYGFFVLADRLQEFLVGLVSGFNSGLNRFLPEASTAERDLLATFASLLLLGIATVLGACLFLVAPLLTRVAGYGPRFELFVRLFAVGLPASIWLRTVVAILRSLEEVGPFNLTLRIGVPTAHLVVAVLGTLVFRDLVVVIVGVLLATGLGGVAATLWLVRTRGLRPRIRQVGGSGIRRRYVWFSIPLFVGGFATITQRLGFYPLIAFYLSGVAGGVFAVGILVGSLVRMPLVGVNQFVPPVAATLHENNHRVALRRLYQVTSRLVVLAVTGVAIPLVVYRSAVMRLFGPEFVEYALLLPVFVAGTYADSAVGSVGILLKMTDNERPWLVVNVVSTAFMLATAIPMTVLYGLPGLVGSYLLLVVVNNGLEVATLYHFERIQPFTRLHAKPVLAAVPLVLVTQAGRIALPGPVAPVVGTVLGLTVYAGTLRVLGFTDLEGRLLASLVARYRGTILDVSATSPDGRFERGLDLVAIAVGLIAIASGFLQAVLTVSVLSPPRVGWEFRSIALFVVLGGALALVVGLLETVPDRYRRREVVSVLVGVASVLGLVALLVLFVV